MRSYLQGKSYTRQSVANIRLREFAYSHPDTYGWRVLSVKKVDARNFLTVYHQSGVELMRCPKGDGWLVRYLGERRRIRCHVSELTTNLDRIKRSIEAQLSKQFAALAV